MASGSETGFAVIIPACNEAATIRRTLTAVASVLKESGVEVIVVANGCQDQTAALASGFTGVQVVEVEQGNKAAALNIGDALATAWPRIYLDADIEAPAEALRTVVAALNCDARLLAGRPSYTYHASSATHLVRSYYRARTRIGVGRGSLWGAGCYAVTQEGHRRFRAFPEEFGDDLFVDKLFTPEEKAVLTTNPVIVRVPQKTSVLLRTLSRVYAGNSALTSADEVGESLRPNPLRNARGARDVYDSCVYVVIALLGRFAAQRSVATSSWLRDTTTR